jgi:xanthine/uracil permease
MATKLFSLGGLFLSVIVAIRLNIILRKEDESDGRR